MTTATKVNPVEAFLLKAREDGQLRSQIEMLKTQPKKQAIEQIVQLAAKAGFKFSAKQYEQCIRMMRTLNGKNDCPITDEELILAACCR